MAIDVISGHTAFIMDRGGTSRLFEVPRIRDIQWSRERDNISEAKLFFMPPDSEHGRRVANGIQPHRHELCIFRGEERVWEGPITLAAMRADGMELQAKDIGHYLARTVIRTADSSAFPNTETAIQRLDRIIRRELNRAWEIADPPVNIVPHIVLHETPTDAQTSSSVASFQMTVHEHLDALAWRGGIDYVILGRAIHLLDVNSSLGQTPPLTRADFTAEPIITFYGMEQTSIAIVTDGQGNAGEAGIVNDYYGPWEMLNTAYDESSGEAPPSIAEMESQAERNLSGRQLTPIIARIPDNSTLDMRGALSMRDLVPAMNVPFRAERFGRVVDSMQKLQKVVVTETSKGEEVKVTLYPAASPDAVEV